MAPAGSPGPLSAPGRLALPTRSDPHSAWTAPLATRAASGHGHPEAQLCGSCISSKLSLCHKALWSAAEAFQFALVLRPGTLAPSCRPLPLVARVVLTRQYANRAL